MDGVTQSKSSPVSLDIYTTSFTNCRTVYPLTILRPLNRYQVGYREHLEAIIQELHSSNCTITKFVGDNPKRAIVREALNHASHYACEYCTSKAGRTPIQKQNSEVEGVTDAIKFMEDMSGSSKMTSTKEKHLQCLTKLRKSLNTTKHRTQLAWPSSTATQGEFRSDAKTEAIVCGIEAGEMDRDEAKGIIGRSLFLDINYFNFTTDIPAEYMHSVCIGLVRRVLELTFTVGETRTRVTTRRLSSPAKYNSLMSTVKVPREFSRRLRNLDLSVIKAQEYRNIITVLFPIVIECIESQAKERRLWLLLAYMIRSCIIPNEEYTNIDHITLKESCQKFYVLYEQLFGVKNCSYTVHVIATHLTKIRGSEPLTATSAFKYENFYSEVRQSFAAGTHSTLKQIFQRTLLKRALSYHSCVLPIFFSEKTTKMEANNIIYIYKNSQYHMYKIHTVHENMLICNEQGFFNYVCKETPELHWNTVGVFKEGGLSEENVPINKQQVQGKVLRVCKLLITVPINVLRES